MTKLIRKITFKNGTGIKETTGMVIGLYYSKDEPYIFNFLVSDELEIDIKHSQIIKNEKL